MQSTQSVSYIAHFVGSARFSTVRGLRTTENTVRVGDSILTDLIARLRKPADLYPAFRQFGSVDTAKSLADQKFSAATRWSFR